MPAAVIPGLYAVLVVALSLAVIRLVRGPSLPDRVVAFDLITALAVALVAVYAIDTGNRTFLDAAIVLALISFLGTIAFAQYLERRVRGG